MTTVQSDQHSSSAGFYGAATLKGGRDYQQDAYWLGEYVAIVADGMGGLPSGDLASRLAVDAAAEVIQAAEQRETAAIIAEAKAVGITLWRDPHEAVYEIKRAFSAAQEALTKLITKGPYTSEFPATTLIIVVRSVDGFVVGHLGDSRVYVITAQAPEINRLAKKTTIRQVTSDHENTWGSITRCVGGTNILNPDKPDIEFVPTDKTFQQLLVATDGLFGYGFTDEAIRSLADQSFSVTTPPVTAATFLVNEAFALGSQDNITVVVGRA